MNTPKIPNSLSTDPSRSHSLSRKESSSSEAEGFKKVFEAELSYSQAPRARFKPGNDMSPEIQASLVAQVVDPTSRSPGDAVVPKDAGNGHGGEDQLPTTKPPSREVKGEPEKLAIEEAGATKIRISEVGKTVTTEGKENGKNVPAAEREGNGTAKNAERPSLQSGEKMTYGQVRKVENAMMSAGSAASNSIQTVSFYHGTSHASSLSRSEPGLTHEGFHQAGAMTSKAMNNDLTSGTTMENESVKAEMSAVLKSVSCAGNSFSDGSFSEGHLDERGPFAGKEGLGLSDVQMTSKPQFVVPTSTAQLVESIRKMQSMIQDQVMVLKNVHQQSMQVMIRPDANVSLYLTLQQGESEVFVTARMDGQTTGLLKPHWAELQKELEQHGIQLGDPDSQFDRSSGGRKGDASEQENEVYHPSRPLFQSSDNVSLPKDGTRESIHLLDPDFEDTQGTLVSWA